MQRRTSERKNPSPCAVLCAACSVLVAVEAQGAGATSELVELPLRVQAQTGEQSKAPAFKAGTLLGKEVVNRQNQVLGVVRELVADERGQIRYVVLSYGGFLGMGGKRTAIPWERVEYSSETEQVIVDVSVERIANAPTYTEANWPSTEETTWTARIDEYYGISRPDQARPPEFPPFSELDLDGDGYLSEEEASAVWRLEQGFSQADQDQDGQVDRAEFSAFELRLEGSDMDSPSMERQPEQPKRGGPQTPLPPSDEP